MNDSMNEKLLRDGVSRKNSETVRAHCANAPEIKKTINRNSIAAAAFNRLIKAKEIKQI